jgi:hypothetical protein
MTNTQPLSAGLSATTLTDDSKTLGIKQRELTMTDLNTTAGTSLAEIESVEALLGDLELGGDVVETGGELNAHDESVVEGTMAVLEAYDDQPVVETAPIAPEVTEPTPAVPAAKTARKARTPKVAKPAKAKVERDLSALPLATFGLTVGSLVSEADRDAVIGLRPKQKKIGEKFDNLFQSIAAGKKPSVYTMACFSVLYAKETVTSAELVAALQLATASTGKSKGAAYNIGTARSQAGQMMELFDVVGIATRTKQTIVFNKDSALAAKLLALA